MSHRSGAAALLVLVQACSETVTQPTATLGVAGSDVVIRVPTGGYDIYVVNVLSGSVVQVTTIAGADEFNPASSPDGRMIVHDVLTQSPFSHNLYVTHLGSGASEPLAGGDGGNDADWSPTGRRIAFDRAVMGDPNLYVVPAAGGARTRVRPNAVDPQWNADGNRLVFVDVTDGSIRAIDLASGREHVVVPFGLNPAWSEDGRRIAYSDGNSLFFVAVNQTAAAVGPPVQLTFDGPGVFNQQPSWSASGRTIVFHSNRGNTVFDFDLWTVPVSGGTPSRLTGAVGQGDFDPAYLGNRLVAFGAFTPSH